jgi:heptosyltransferase-2
MQNKALLNIFLTILTIAFSLFRGNARKFANASTFLVINPTGNIGDMVCTTPVFRAIKNKRPGARLIVVGSAKNQLMMQGNTDIDRYIVVGKSVWSTIREIAREKVDVGIIINSSTVDFATLFLGNVRFISCFMMTPKYRHIQSRSYTRIATLGYQTEYVPGKYVPRQYVALLKPCNLDTDDIRKFVAYTKEADVAVTKALLERGISSTERVVAIAPGAGTKVKQWPAERFGYIANYLTERYGVGIVIIGGPRDIPEVERMRSVFDAGVRYCNFADQTLEELKATLSKIVLIIGNDSGPIYIAESFGAGTLVLVGPTDEAEHPLQDETHRIVMAEGRGESLLKSHLTGEDTIDMEHAREQIASITVEQVCAEIDDVFKKMKIEVLK